MNKQKGFTPHLSGKDFNNFSAKSANSPIGAGFTLVELVIVIAIIAILAGIVLVNVSVYINKAKDAKIKSDIANIEIGMAACYSALNNYPTCYGDEMSLVDDIMANNGNTALTEHDDISTAYCVSSPLSSSSTTYVCIDSTGATRSSATSTCSSVTYACSN